MTKEQLLIQIHFLAKKLGPISQLAFRKEKLEDILEELRFLHNVVLFEERDED